MLELSWSLLRRRKNSDFMLAKTSQRMDGDITLGAKLDLALNAEEFRFLNVAPGAVIFVSPLTFGLLS